MTKTQQRHTLTYLPQDEILQALLYDTSAFKNDFEALSQNSEENHQILIEQLKTKSVLITKEWNPLLFAIYYGQTEIVSSILKKMDS